jgi:hypothetical protein
MIGHYGFGGVQGFVIAPQPSNNRAFSRRDSLFKAHTGSASNPSSSSSTSTVTTEPLPNSQNGDVWIAASFEQQPALSTVLRTEPVVGPGRVLIYDTSLRGTLNGMDNTEAIERIFLCQCQS